MAPHPATPTQTRLAFPIARIFLLGGIAGTGLNALTILLLHGWLGTSITVSFAAGTLLNLIFHHVYYHLIFLNREITLRTPLWLQCILYVLISAGAGVAGWVLHDAADLPLWLTMVLVLGAMAAANAVVNRISTFSSAELAEVEYAGVDESFYQDQTSTQKVNFIRARFHNSRFRKLHDFVAEHYRPGMAVADLGCGNCLWNTDKLPVTGVDMNPGMLNWAKNNGYIADYQVSADLSHTMLPKAAFDIVVMSETLEHLLNLDQTLQEVRSLLKKDGRFLITVPYDFFLGPFFIMFNVNCLYQGYVNGSRYHLYRCGHVNHFTRPRLKAALETAGLRLESIRLVNGLSLFAVARRGLVDMGSSANSERGGKTREAALIVVAVIAALFLFYNLDVYALWDDEANTALMAQGVWATGDTVAQIGDNLVAWGDGMALVGKYDRSQPPLQFYLCAPFVGLLGPTALAARLPFALIGLATVIALLLWARKAASSFEYAAWCVVVLGSVSFFLYCRQARYFAPALAFTLGACWAYWSLLQGRKREWVLGFMLAGTLVSNYLCGAAIVASLSADYVLWGRAQKRLGIRELLRIALPLMVIGIPVLCIWYPLSRYASDALDRSQQGAWLRKLKYCWWFFRDASASQLVSGLLLLVCPWLFRLERSTWYLRIPCAIAIYLLVNGVFAPQGNWDRVAIRYAVPVLLGGLALIVLVSRAVYNRNRIAGVAVLLLASASNLFYLDWATGWPIGPIPKLMPALFIGELLQPQEEPYTPVAEWILQNVPPGSLVAVAPTFARYPLMFHAPGAVYGWQLRPDTAEQRFPGVDPRQVRGAVVPDYLVCFGLGSVLLTTDLSQHLPPGLAYTMAAVIDRYSVDQYRPEIYLHRFGKPKPYSREFQIRILQRAPALDCPPGTPPQAGVWHTGDK